MRKPTGILSRWHRTCKKNHALSDSTRTDAFGPASARFWIQCHAYPNKKLCFLYCNPAHLHEPNQKMKRREKHFVDVSDVMRTQRRVCLSRKGSMRYKNEEILRSCVAGVVLFLRCNWEKEASAPQLWLHISCHHICWRSQHFRVQDAGMQWVGGAGNFSHLVSSGRRKTRSSILGAFISTHYKLRAEQNLGNQSSCRCDLSLDQALEQRVRRGSGEDWS